MDMTKKMLSIGSSAGSYIGGCNTIVEEDIPLEIYLAFRYCIVDWKNTLE
ncbi:MAG: hypothetical protein ACYC54_11500 [Sedimentisphaerales bacterium]